LKNRSPHQFLPCGLVAPLRGKLWFNFHRAIGGCFRAYRIALPSERTLHRIIAALRKSGMFVFQGGLGRSNELLMARHGTTRAAFNFMPEKRCQFSLRLQPFRIKQIRTKDLNSYKYLS
jgi:hypothetical protein